MATLRSTIRDVLETAEGRLRQVIADAAKTGDYDGVDLARLVAGQLRELASGTVSERIGVDPPTPVGAKNAESRATISQRSYRRKHSEYPRFTVEGGILHKVGWSKKDGQEYVHKIPKEAYELIVHAIGEAASSGRKLVTSEQLEQRLQSSDSPVPVYQVYATLALLRTKEIIEKNGRKGYRIPRDATSRGLQTWAELEMKAAGTME